MKTVSTGYVLKTNSATTTIDLSSGSFLSSARVRWKGIDTTLASTETNYSTNGIVTVPSVTSGYGWVGHVLSGTITVRNNTSSSVSVRTASFWGTGSIIYGSVVSFAGNETKTIGAYNTTTTSDYSGNSAFVVADAGGADVTVLSLSTQCSTDGSKVVKTTNPSLTVAGGTVSAVGSLDQDAVSSWVSIPSGVELASNLFTHNFAFSSRGYVEIEVNYEPKLPIPTIHSPEHDIKTEDTSISFEFTLNEDVENSATTYHARVRIDNYTSMPSPTVYTSEDDQTDWQYWDGLAWDDFPALGVDPDTKVRITKTLSSGTYYWDVAACDDYACGLIGTARKLKIMLSVADLYVLEISGVAYDAFSLKVTETSNGELGSIVASIDNADGSAFDTIEFGDTVSVGFNDELGNNDEFSGFVRDLRPSGLVLEVYAILFDGILAERIIKEDYGSQDIGQTVKDMIEDYCPPLTATNVDVSTGFVVEILTDGKTPLTVLEELRKNYGLFYYVDVDGDLHFYDKTAITDLASVGIVYGEEI